MTDVPTSATATPPGPADDPTAEASARSSRQAWAYGLATVTDAGVVLDTWFPSPQLGPAPQDTGPHAVPAELASLEGTDPYRGVRQQVVRTEIDLDAAPADASDAYLRLHLLSHRLAAPHSLNLSGIFGVLPVVVWTDHGPCAVEGFESTRLRLRASGRGAGGRVTVYGVDKFPRMVDYVLPTGVRIADADRVRLGAHLAPGTTVMHEGFVNFNAGSLGASMIEGRVSAGVVVGDGSDVGGGASIMGTLSGGGTQVISIGRRTLVGANAGLGISLGDDCIVEAGLYLTAGSKVLLLQPDAGPQLVKARDLSGQDGLLFRRNSQTGALEALARTGKRVELNAALHANG